MSKNNDYTATIRNYISNMVGDNISFEQIPIKVKRRLPLLITEAFDLYIGTLLEVPVVYAVEKTKEGHTPAQIEKFLNIIRKATGNAAIYVTSDLVSYNARRLIEHRVNFIVPNKQMFVPSLLLDIKKPVERGADITEDIAPFTQFLLLYHLEKQNIDGLSAKDISKEFNVSYATANRAVRWINDKSLANVDNGKEHKIEFVLNGKELWLKALPYLVSPIFKTVIVDKSPNRTVISGINALSEYTMINPETNGHYAISRDTYRSIDKNVIDVYGDITLEIWKYEPNLLSESNTVDKLSLYLSLKDNDDERIQIELEHLIESIKW